MINKKQLKDNCVNEGGKIMPLVNFNNCGAKKDCVAVCPYDVFEMRPITTDHTMSKSIYLDDPDGINVELTLETPERFKRVVTTGGLRIEGTDGVIRSASEHLEVNEILKVLKGDESKHIISKDTFLGHVHLYANNVVHSNTFYKQIGFLQFNYLPQYMYADLSAGGTYQHRIVMNSWHGTNKPLAPKENAGLRHFQINYKNKEKFTAAIAKLPKKEEKNGDFWTFDPTGNKILLTNKT